jgi:pantoate kinase
LAQHSPYYRARPTTIHASAFSPCNITGFFRIHHNVEDPLQAGSTGVGIALETGVTTRVTIRNTRNSRISATFNGQQLPRKAVSIQVARRYLELDGRSYLIDISHESRVPTGRGYGTSGAGALSLSLALNHAMSLSLSDAEAAQIAHLCEIECKTGLGTVASVFSGGLTIRTLPGAPGIGKVRKLSLPTSFRIVSAGFGPISTRLVLSNLSLKESINACGKALVEKFLQASSHTNFMTLSRKFSICVGLMSSRLRRVMNTLDSFGFDSSMMMLGESLFCLLPRDKVADVVAILRGLELSPVTSKVARSGARLI